MTSIVSSTFNPRSYIYSSNSETLILQSATPEARLSFINSSFSNGSFRYLLGASSQTLTVSSILDFAQTNIQTFSTIANIPYVETFGSIVSSNIRFSQSAPNNAKLLIFRDDNPISSTQFTGIGINTSTNAIEYRTPGTLYDINSHIFYSGTGPFTSTPLMSIQPNPTSGIAQVGIGVLPGSINHTTSLSLANDLRIAGDLFVKNIPLDPNNIILLDANTNRISSNQMPYGIVYTSGTSNQIDQSLIPATFTGSYFKTYKNFGIGTRNPLQRLHVQGNAYITDRLSVGISNPATRLHVVEYAAAIPTATFANIAGGDPLHTYISSNTQNGPVNIPVLTVVGTHQGVGIGTSSVNITNALEVVGNTQTTSLSTNNISISGSITGNISTLNMSAQSSPFLYLSSNLSSNIFNIGLPTDFKNDCSVYGTFTCYGNTFTHNLINTQSDMRLKCNVTKITDCLSKVNNINGYTYNVVSEQNTIMKNNRYAGVIAQEIQNVLPEAVSSYSSGYLSVKYDSLIPLLIESIKELTAKVNYLENIITQNNMDTT